MDATAEVAHSLMWIPNTPEKWQKINIDSLNDGGITCSYSPMNSTVTVWKATNAFRVSKSNIRMSF